MYDSMIGLMHYYLTDFVLTGREPGPVGSGNPSIFPYGAFRVADGELIIAAFQTQFWRRLCDVLGLPELARDGRFATNDLRVANRDELTAIMTSVLTSRTRAEWSAALDAADIPNASVMSVGEVVANPQTAIRGMVEGFMHPLAGRLQVTGRPIKFIGRELEPMKSSPLLGEHSQAILREVLNYSDEDIKALADAGVTELAATPAET
jgi:crotonobetainyl-CoA:carnitine CoA-transferase CaiB-like acyl-CoA transferase